MLEWLEGEIVQLGLNLPDEIFQFIIGDGVVREGKTLDKKIQIVLKLSSLKPKLESQPPEKSRVLYRDVLRHFDIDYQPLYDIRQIEIPVESGKIQMRLYYPENVEKVAPCLLFFHGGGFVVGDLETHDRFLRYLSRNSGRVVISVDYRRAPEYKFPIAFEDCFTAYLYVQKNANLLGIHPGKIGVGGDSAGAAIALYIVAQAIGKNVVPPVYQLLIYPLVDMSREYPSYQTYDDFGLTPPLIRYFKKHFLNKPDDSKNQQYFPFLQGKFNKFPPTLIQIAGFDPLHDEAILLEQKLRKKDVEVDWIEYPTLIHGYVHLGGVIPAARIAVEDIIRYMLKF